MLKSLLRFDKIFLINIFSRSFDILISISRIIYIIPIANFAKFQYNLHGRSTPSIKAMLQKEELSSKLLGQIGLETGVVNYPSRLSYLFAADHQENRSTFFVELIVHEVTLSMPIFVSCVVFLFSLFHSSGMNFQMN